MLKAAKEKKKYFQNLKSHFPLIRSDAKTKLYNLKYESMRNIVLPWYNNYILSQRIIFTRVYPKNNMGRPVTLYEGNE